MVETDLKYEGYLKRQLDQVDRQARMEARLIPDTLEYAEIGGLKHEAQQKLQAVRPRTLGQAARIQGVTPADLSLVAVWLEKSDRTPNS